MYNLIVILINFLVGLVGIFSFIIVQKKIESRDKKMKKIRMQKRELVRIITNDASVKDNIISIKQLDITGNFIEVSYKKNILMKGGLY